MEFSSEQPTRLSRDAIQKMSIQSPELEELLQRKGPLERENFTDIEGVRKMFDEIDQKIYDSLEPLPEDFEERRVQIPVSDGWKSSTIVVRPSQQTSGAALIVLFHGGGWMLGSAITMAPYARGLARLFNAVTVCPSYRLAPENPFPVGINDTWDVLKWLARNAASIGAEPRNGFIVGGISAGANISSVLSRKAAEDGLQPPLTGQWISVTSAFQQHTVPEKYKSIWTSYQQNTDAWVVDQTGLKQIFDNYCPDFESPLYNPLAPGFDISKMPPAFIQVAGMDIIRDDGIIYAYSLDDEGVATRLNIYPGVPHSFWHFLPDLPQSEKAALDIAKGVSWMLKTKVDLQEVLHVLKVPRIT